MSDFISANPDDDFMSPLELEFARMEAECNGWRKIVADIAALVPLPSVIQATGTTGDLINWIKEQVEGRKTAEAALSHLHTRLATAEAENKRWQDNWDANVQEMSEKFRAVNIAKVIEATGADIFALRDRAEAAEAKLAEAREVVDGLLGPIVIIQETWADAQPIYVETVVGKVRRARSFLSSIAEKSE